MPLSSAGGAGTFTLGRVELEIRPEPTDEEREAIPAALAAAEDGAEGSASPWREAGLREATGSDDPDRP